MFEHVFLEIIPQKEVTYAQIWWSCWSLHITSRRDHTAAGEQLYQHILRTVSCVRWSSILLEPQLALSYRDETVNLTWESSSHYNLIFLTHQYLCSWAGRRGERSTATLTSCTFEGVLIYICVINGFLLHISASSVFSCLKSATSFLLPLNPHSNSVCVKHSIFVQNNEPSPRSSLRRNHRFLFSKYTRTANTPCFHDQSIMATEMRSKTGLKKTTLFHLSLPQQELAYYLLQTA